MVASTGRNNFYTSSAGQEPGVCTKCRLGVGFIKPRGPFVSKGSILRNGTLEPRGASVCKQGPLCFAEAGPLPSTLLAVQPMAFKAEGSWGITKRHCTLSKIPKTPGYNPRQWCGPLSREGTGWGSRGRSEARRGTTMVPRLSPDFLSTEGLTAPQKPAGTQPHCRVLDPLFSPAAAPLVLPAKALIHSDLLLGEGRKKNTSLVS